MKDYSLPEVQKKCRKVNDYPAIFKSNFPAIGGIIRDYGFDFTQAYIETWIINLREFINVGKKMNDDQTRETAMLILDEYTSLTLADINLIFKRAKTGFFGVTYDRLDGQLILSWFDKYFNDRCIFAANNSIREADRFKGPQNISSFDRVTERVTRITNKFKF